jgi:RHS repeat-associated protein
VLIVTNFYDAKSRRVKKVTPDAIMTFFYDGWNLVEERISYTNGTTSTIRYYWDKDLSGTLQGAGGVGGLLYLTIDGVPYIPDYDNIGNITRYLDANGNVVAQYTYGAFGGTLSQSGTLASFFRHRFSTKYLDVETGFYYYGYRFYHPDLCRWLNRDPIGEEGGANLYSFCNNAALYRYDIFGNIPVSVVTWRRNSFLQRLMNGGEKYSIVNVKNTSDISVEDMESSRKWGLFVSTLQIEECQVVVTLTILLNQKMPNTGNKDITYHYKPHNGEDGGIATSSDGSPQVRGGILAHEQGHADSFLESFLPRFRNEVARFKAGQLTESDKAEIRRIFARCKKEASTDSGNRANESHINWYNNNGYQIDTR